MVDHAIRTLTDIQAWEQVPLDRRMIDANLLERVRRLRREHGDATALIALPNGRIADVPIQWSYDEYCARFFG